MDFVKNYCVNKYPVQLLKQQQTLHIPHIQFVQQQTSIPKFIFNPYELVLHPYDQFYFNSNNVVKRF